LDKITSSLLALMTFGHRDPKWVQVKFKFYGESSGCRWRVSENISNKQL